MKLYLLLLSLTINPLLYSQFEKGTLTNDGTWCWFSDPRAIMVDDNITTGWVKSDGTIEAASLDLINQKIRKHELYYQLEKDDHNNPAFALINNKIIAMYTRHSKKDLFINHLADFKTESFFSKPQFIHPISKEELVKFPRETMTYANPFCLKEENNRIYCFGRWTGFKPNMMWSDDGGQNWSKSKVFITNYPFDINNRPYVKYFSDGLSKIHIVFTDGHPRDEPTNSVYYSYYQKGKFYNIKDEEICNIEDLPFEPKNASLVFKSNKKEGRAWIADIGQDEDGRPLILYTKSPTETNHEYWYARYIKGMWVNHKICDSGKWFPQTPEGRKEWEAHYFGGMTVHPNNCNVIYLSRQINDVFEIERWETKDSGKTWSSIAVTQNSKFDNVRPYIPRGFKNSSKEVVLWMENQKYIHYTDYLTSIKYAIKL